jgi:hypothetical protein
MKKVEEKDYKFEMTNGSSLKAYIGTTYSKLVELLGPPTLPNPSGDEKVQKEWVVEFEGEYFTIYDWKTYNVDITINELDIWHIGGKVSANRFLDYLHEELEILEIRFNFT